MAEKVLKLPLSGSEVKEAILDKCRTALERDCFLSPNSAYEFFEATVNISLKCHDTGRIAPVEMNETIKVGDPVEDQYLDMAEASFEIEPAAPNTVRVETGQEVPVLTKNAQGKGVQKGIKYARKSAKKKIAEPVEA